MGPAAQCPPADASFGRRRPFSGLICWREAKPCGPVGSIPQALVQRSHHGIESPACLTEGALHLKQVRGFRAGTHPPESLGTGSNPFEHLGYRCGQGTEFGVFSLHCHSVPHRVTTSIPGAE